MNSWRCMVMGPIEEWRPEITPDPKDPGFPLTTTPLHQSSVKLLLTCF